MEKIGLFYGPEKGSVHRVAEKIKAIIGENKIDLISVRNATAADLERFDKIIFGISTVGKETWDSAYSNTDWSKFFPVVSQVDYSNKTVALFGLGDHVTYPGHFVSTMGILAKELLKHNARIVGQVSTDGYEFDDSEAVIEGKFIGLPIDEDFEPELTDERIKSWISDIKGEFDI